MTHSTSQIADLEADVLIATDSGTHGHPETTEVYEQLDGTQYGVRIAANGHRTLIALPAESRHGRMRHLKHDTPASRRVQIAEIQRLDKADAVKLQKQQSHIENLKRGWDGYQFIGIEAGQAKVAQLS